MSRDMKRCELPNHVGPRRTWLAMPHCLALIMRLLPFLSHWCAFAFGTTYVCGPSRRPAPKGRATRRWSCLPFATCLCDLSQARAVIESSKTPPPLPIPTRPFGPLRRPIAAGPAAATLRA